MLNKDERDLFLEEISKGKQCYITAYLDGKLCSDYVAFVKDLMDNFNLFSFDLTPFVSHLAFCISFDNLADWKHFHQFVANYGMRVIGYRIEENYEI